MENGSMVGNLIVGIIRDPFIAQIIKIKRLALNV